MYFFYFFACIILYIICLPLLVLTSFKPKHRLSIPHRFFPFAYCLLRRFGNNAHKGFCHNFTPQVWLHACSYGEVKSLQPIVDVLLGKQNPNDDLQIKILPNQNPHNKPLQILLTTITHTGYTLAKETYRDYENVRVEFLPFEIFLPFYAKYFYPKDSANAKHSSLKLLCVFEAELWLNLFVLAKNLNAHTMLLNARISSRSYPRYKKFGFFYRHIFALIDEIFAQSDEDKTRLESLGAKHIQVIGNLKSYTLPAITHNYDKPNGVLFLAASTHEGEEELIIKAFMQAFDNSLADISNAKNSIDFVDASEVKFLAIAPRHPERFSQVASLLESKNLNFTRLTQGYENAFRNNSKILLIDKLGELNNFYAIAQVSILGGSFVKVGGHNPLEPAHFKNVLISGEHIFNQKALFATVQNAYIIPQDKLESTLKNYQNLQQSTIKHSYSSLSKVLESFTLHLHNNH